MDLYPARSLLDGLPVVVRAPALHEGQPEGDGQLGLVLMDALHLRELRFEKTTRHGQSQSGKKARLL